MFPEPRTPRTSWGFSLANHQFSLHKWDEKPPAFAALLVFGVEGVGFRV